MSVLLATLYLALLLLKSVRALRYLQAYPAPGDPGLFDNVTICQPILSGDSALERTLAKNVEALSGARFLWLIDADDLPAHTATAALQSSHPNADIRVLLLPPVPEGTNPKLFKLEAGRALVATTYLVVLDDDTVLPPRSLQALTEALTYATLATGLPCYGDGATWPARLLGQFVNNNAAQTYLAPFDMRDPVSINGMCYALRTHTLDAMQGFRPILHHLTDDLAMAGMVRAGGGRVRQTPFVQVVGTDLPNALAYARQMHRWFLFAILLIRRQRWREQARIVLFHGVPPVLLAATLLLCAVNPAPCDAIVSVALVLLRGVSLCAVQHQVFGQVRHRPLLSLLSELLEPVHLLHAVCYRRIRWRTRTYQVHDNAHFESR